MTRRRHPHTQRALEEECIEALITKGVIDGPPRPFAKLTRREQGLVKAAHRLISASLKRRTDEELIAELIWACTWGPCSEDTLASDDGKTSPAPSDPRELINFHLNNLVNPYAPKMNPLPPKIQPGDQAEAVRFFRATSNGASPDAMWKSLQKEVRKVTLGLQVVAGGKV